MVNSYTSHSKNIKRGLNPPKSNVRDIGGWDNGDGLGDDGDDGGDY